MCLISRRNKSDQPISQKVFSITVSSIFHNHWFRKIKPMWKCLKPAVLQLTSRGRLIWFLKEVCLYILVFNLLDCYKQQSKKKKQEMAACGKVKYDPGSFGQMAGKLPEYVNHFLGSSKGLLVQFALAVCCLTSRNNTQPN